MQAKKQRDIRSGSEYEKIFPGASMRDETIKRGAVVEDTVQFIPKAVEKTKWQTENISKILKGKTLYDTCKNIWDFLYRHVRYKKDEDGLEQIRSPRRLWRDRFRGVDCDCYTTTICTMLLNCGVRAKDIRLRITKYKEDRFQHIYPIVFRGDGSYITIDCVVDEFNYEEPYTEKKDYNMDLQFLDGINDDDQFLQEQETEELGKLKIFSKIGAAVKKAANVVNKVNPATVLLRTGLLASMKLNLMKVAGKLRWAYLSEEQAKQKGIIIEKHRKLKEVMKKLEGIFFTAGGKPENLKSAILTGKGNQDRQVLAGLEIGETESYDESTPLSELLGEGVYQTENTEGLGEPVTAATIAAASAALATIAALIKQIGDIFPKGNKLNESGNQEGNPQTDQVNIEPETAISPMPTQAAIPASTAKNTSSTAVTASDSESSSGNGADANKKEEGFWDKNKKWLKPTLWGVGGLGTLFGLIKVFGGKKKKEEKKETENKPVSGVKQSVQKKKQKKGKKIKSIALK